MCRAMKRTDAERQRTGAERRRWFRGGKSRGRAVRSARRCPPWVSRTPVTLRPVNVRGHRAKGMRAPENTNQFLMTEKYRLHALRSDSVDSASDSDTEHELTDMDTYLCAWEDAHGALLEPDTERTLGGGDRDRRQPPEPSVRSVRTVLFLQDEDSAQYFPSEDDLNLSDNFMHRDFTEFCHRVTS